MSDSSNPSADETLRRRSAWSYLWISVGSIVLILVLVVAALLVYSATPRFSRSVKKQVVAALENSTGGRVELQSVHWSLHGLSVTVDNLTIHGLEQPSEAPYLHIDRVYARIRIVSFFRHKIALSYAEADHPVFHLIVYPDGSTNQPRPRPQPQSNRSLTDTIFNLEASRVDVYQGLLLINERRIPFNLTANELKASVTYSKPADRYLGDVQVADLDLQRDSAAPLRSRLTLSVEMGRSSTVLKSLHFTSEGSQMDASGSVADYAHPEWKLAAQGSIELRQVSALTGVRGLRRGVATVAVEAAGAGKDQYAIHGNFRLADAAFDTSYLKVAGTSAQGSFSITPEEIALSQIKARLQGGGGVDAAVRFLHWNAPAPPKNTPARGRRSVRSGPISSASILAQVRGVRLPAIMRMVAPREYWNLGFDTAADGTVRVDWTGSGEDLTVAANMRLNAPGGLAPGQVGVNGSVNATYFERGGKVQIQELHAQTPASQLQLSGVLGVYPPSGPSAVQVQLTTSSLAEFDSTLTDLGLAAGGKKGVAAIPVVLDGRAEFTGTIAGSLLDPDIRGHLAATNIATEFPGDFSAQTMAGVQRTEASAGHSAASLPASAPASKQPEASSHLVRWDSLDATGEYSSAAISIQHATLTRGGATIVVQGRLESHRIGPRRQVFDSSSALNLTAGIHQVSLGDLVAIAGTSIPASGTVNLAVHAAGTLGSLNGGGQCTIQGGEIAGEPYHSLTAVVIFAGSHIQLTSLKLLQDSGSVSASGSYDLASKTFQAELNGGNFELAHFQQLRKTGLEATGSLKFDVQASGTLKAPSISFGLHLTNATLLGENVGGLDAAGHTQNGLLLYTARTTLKATEMELHGQVGLHDPYTTEDTVTLTAVDIDPLLRMAKVPNLQGHSHISGSLQIAGPAKEPKHLSGRVQIGEFSAVVGHLNVGNQGPLLASIRDGVVHIIQAHIVGPNANATISGSVGFFGARELNLNAGGSLNVKLAESFNSEITSSGEIDFKVQAAGTMHRPQLTGQLHLANVALSYDEAPTSMSGLNGTLIFDQDRLELQNLTGMVGGGQLKLAGFVTYQDGIYGNITATGKGIRVRYSGASATADTTLRLQGTSKDMQLSGNVQITRFKIGPTFDFAIFSRTPTSIAPPNLNALSNHVRLDVQISSAPELDFQNSYAQLAGSLNLRIRGTAAQPNILGQVTITEGRAKFAGTTYRLQHGSIYFTNPVRIDPVIDIDATTRIEEYDVTVGLHGSASHLAPTFRSDPPLPQADVISLLALGRTQQEQQLSSQEADQAGSNPTTNALLGGALNAAVGSRVQRLFGVGSVKIDPTYVGNLGNSTARITVQQNISRNVQLTYATNVNTTAEQLIQAQVNLSENVSVLAIRDEAGVFSMVLKVHHRAR